MNERKARWGHVSLSGELAKTFGDLLCTVETLGELRMCPKIGRKLDATAPGINLRQISVSLLQLQLLMLGRDQVATETGDLTCPGPHLGAGKNTTTC